MSGVKKAVPFEAGGVEYSLRYSMNAMVAYQEQFNESLLDGLTELEANSTDMVRLRGAFWAGLYGQEVSKDQAGDIMDDLSFERVFELIREAAEAAFPPVETSGKAGAREAGKKKTTAKT